MSGEVFPAHIRKIDGEEELWQTVEEHCRNTAKYAAENLSDIGMSHVGYVAGLCHDIGKYTNEFREYIKKAVRDENVKKGSVNHSFAGVRYILNPIQNANIDFIRITKEIIAYAIGAHHGLFDVIDKKGKHGLYYRLMAEGIPCKEAIENAELLSLSSKIQKDFDLAQKEIEEKILEIHKLELNSKKRDVTEGGFYVSLLVRMILSALIDGDRQDTVEFMTNTERKAIYRENYWSDNIKFFEKRMKNSFTGISTPINCARAEISDACKEAANKPCGIYRLNIPTGAGKTLDSLRYALYHAEKWKKKRIIYVMPLLAIIEQNAEVVRDFVMDKNDVLEHHSNVVVEEGQKERYELLTENWNSPMIITTLVQFLNTLFKHKTSSIRRMHSLANSIIIFDEVQTVPSKMLTLFNLACNFLEKVCGATVILCSATPPSFEKTAHPMRDDIEDLVSVKKDTLKVFERVQYNNKGAMHLEELAGFAEEVMSTVKSLLIVCNTKTEAQRLFEMMQNDEGNKLFHISAGMCRAHRSNVIRDLRKALKESREGVGKVICVSTQVIEAGVDVSFESVIRLQAGMDSIIQSAGRCNRNGELKGKANTYIVDLKGEKLNRLKEIQEAKNATYSVLLKEASFSSLDSVEAISFYYQQLFKEMKEGYQDYVIEGEGVSIYELLSSNTCRIQTCKYGSEFFLRQSFKEAGENFEVFDDQTIDVVVPYEDGRKLIAELGSERAKYDLVYAGNLVKELAGYTVGLYNYQMQKLKENDGIAFYENVGVYAVQPEFYDEEMGILLEAKAQKSFMF